MLNSWKKYKKPLPYKKTFLKSFPPKMDLTPEMKKLYDLIEDTKTNVFLTGKAGTGKSTFLQHIRATSKKNLAIVAPTGVAAQNVSGQTIHSFFNFGFKIVPENVKKVTQNSALFKSLELLIIDEISMVRADIMDCIDKSLKLNRGNSEPFGGVQLLVIGDLYQLPPVLTRDEEMMFYQNYESPYFFDAKSLLNFNLEVFELEKIFRQQDTDFINFLNSLRIGELEEQDFKYASNFLNNKKTVEDLVYLVSTNKQADLINQEKLEKLPGTIKSYTSAVTGNYDQRSMPTEETLNLKIGARVMVLNNDPMKRWVNGDVGEVINTKPKSVEIRFDSGKQYEITENKWEAVRFTFNEETQKIEPEILGSFTQLPIRLSWASTIHKSQGKSLQNVLIDLGNGAFAPGQAYVAFSRCRTAEGLCLARELSSKDVIVDPRIVNYMRSIS